MEEMKDIFPISCIESDWIWLIWFTYTNGIISVERYEKKRGNPVGYSSIVVGHIVTRNAQLRMRYEIPERRPYHISSAEWCRVVVTMEE
jgi:hypothetical protein